MVFLEMIEEKLPTFISTIFNKGTRARRLIGKMREVRGIRDPIHGRNEDTRSLPSARIFSFTLVLDNIERSLRNLVEA